MINYISKYCYLKFKILLIIIFIIKFYNFYYFNFFLNYRNQYTYDNFHVLNFILKKHYKIIINLLRGFYL